MELKSILKNDSLDGETIISKQTKEILDNCGGVKEIQDALFPPMLQQRRKISEALARNPSADFTIQCTIIPRPLSSIDKIKESKQLYCLTSQYAARWPIECEVLEERVLHIDYLPPSPEGFYEPKGTEPQPQPVGVEVGAVVYDYHPITPVSYFTRSTIGGSISTRETHLSNYDGLMFESRFESGNLAKAYFITHSYYELHLRADLYTNKHQQWFYFRVSNTRRNMLYRFSIVNLTKSNSLYNEGMKPLMYSVKDAKFHRIGWRRCGKDIVYYPNDSSDIDKNKENLEKDGFENSTYTLTFTVEFPHDNDQVYFAHSYPYTYSDLQDYLNRIVQHPIKSAYSTLRLLCRTLAGNNVYYLTITSPTNILPSSPTKRSSETTSNKKQAIVLTARVHPGETPSSYMMKGIIDYLTSETKQAKQLRDKFVFKIIPMLNPDGVIVGNNRCCLTGRDLNRQYRTVIRETYPSIWHTKLLIRRLIEDCGVALYCDLHAHSRKHNIFIYGCESRRDKYLQEQIFPLMLHKNSADKFSFEDCKFRIQRAKEGTGRVVVWLLGVQNSYTLEASFGGTKLLSNRYQTHFTTQDYESIGKSFCDTLLDYTDDHPTKEKLRVKIIERLIKNGSNADVPTNIDLSDYSSDDGESISDDQIFQDPVTINFEMANIQPMSTPTSPGRISLSKKPKTTKPKKDKLLQIQRQILPVTRQTLDWPSTDPYMNSSLESQNSVSNIAQHNSRIKTPRTRYEQSTINKTETNILGGKCMRSISVVDFCQINQQKKDTNERRLQSVPPQRLKPTYNTELESKLTALRHQIWSNIPFSSNVPLSWGVSILAATTYQNDCENLIKSSSQKLFNQKKEKTKLKKLVKTKSTLPSNDERLLEQNYLKESTKIPTKKSKIKVKCRSQNQLATNKLNRPKSSPNLRTNTGLPKDKSNVEKIIMIINKEENKINTNKIKKKKVKKIKQQ